mmetsp:Transcript_15529/g.43040  ORF Transcript_15529/g.43040 Transcript_15529/m.43040 type:complete len:94 (+) Transcript_15529:376-657(+)
MHLTGLDAVSTAFGIPFVESLRPSKDCPAKITVSLDSAPAAPAATRRQLGFSSLAPLARSFTRNWIPHLGGLSCPILSYPVLSRPVLAKRSAT